MINYRCLALISAISLQACAPCSRGDWGYTIAGGTKEYAVQETRVTPRGVHVDDALNQTPDESIDLLTDHVEQCLPQTIDRSSFVLKIPDNWHWACENSDVVRGKQQLLDSEAPEYGCTAKGIEPQADCPCRWRALIQCPNVIVATPNLYLYQDALIRWVTGSVNPWADEHLAQCASPILPP